MCPFWRQLDPGDQANTAEWDFCPNRQKALGSEWEAKSATSSQFWYRTRGEAEIYATMEVPGPIIIVTIIINTTVSTAILIILLAAGLEPLFAATQAPR